MTSKEELKKMLGQNDSKAPFKLNQVALNGDTGKFMFTELLGEQVDNKYPRIDLGDNLKGVILKMRWRLYSYDESTKTSTSTSEFDDKNTDTIIVFRTKEKGLAVDIKEKHGLTTQRVLYVFLPSRNETVRMYVKPSGFSGAEEAGKKIDMGLFDYMNSFTKDELVCDYVTLFKSIYRENKDNPRRNHWAAIFERASEVLEENKEKIYGMVEEVDSRIDKDFAHKVDEPIATPTQEINPDDIPF